VPLGYDSAFGKPVGRGVRRQNRDPGRWTVPVLAVPDTYLFTHRLGQLRTEAPVGVGPELVRVVLGLDLSEGEVGQAKPVHHIAWMRRLLRGFADRGGTVLLSSHLLAEVEAIADRIVVIHSGRIVADQDAAEIRAGGQRLEDLFLRLVDSSLEATR